MGAALPWRCEAVAGSAGPSSLGKDRWILWSAVASAATTPQLSTPTSGLLRISPRAALRLPPSTCCASVLPAGGIDRIALPNGILDCYPRINTPYFLKWSL